MLKKRLLGTAAATAALLLAGTAAANADSCTNVSRAPAPCGWSCPGPVTDGNWAWLPSIGVPVFAWGFAPPGSTDSQLFGAPGANGNYLNQRGASSWLHENSLCVNGNTARAAANSTHGIQSGCGQ